MRHRGVLIKLMLLGCISIVAFVGIGIYGVSNTRSTFTWINDVYRTAEDVRRGSEKIVIPMNEVRQLTLSIVIAPNPKFQQDLNERQRIVSEQLDETLSQWKVESGDPHETAAFQHLRAEWNEYQRLKDYTISKVLMRYREEAFLNANGAAREQFQRVKDALNVWMKARIAVVDQVYQNANAQHGSAVRVSVIVIVVLTLLIGGIGFVTARGIFRPLAVLKESAARIANRETVRTIAVHSQDELGDLARSMEKMAEAIQTYIAQQRASEAEVRKLNAGLERRVEERTADLERAVGELRIAKEAAEDAHRRLIETERLKSEFFANVSHELRTPLTLILAPLESALSGEAGPLPDPSKRLLETMHNNAIRLLQMVTGLLDFAKLEAKRVEVKREPVQIAALTRAILGDFAPMLKRTGLASVLDTEPAEAVVNIDRYVYERILFNLLSNAVKFTPAGGTISLCLRVTQGRLRLAVTDTGIGIAEADLAKLFQKFRQLEGASTRRFEGTGLGLALVKEFSGLLEGTVSVTSKLGEGSTFTIECAAPAAEADEAEASSDRPKKSMLQQFDTRPLPLDQANQEGRETAAKVLIAEDNPELASYIVSLLEDLCQIRVVSDGEEALQSVRQWAPDVVLSDVMMPRRDGLSLCRELKSAKETASIPVVLLTALTHREALLKGWEAGANEYLFKPFHPRELVTRIKAILSGVQDRKRWENELAAQARELARSNAELAQFAYVASHDLQEPLRMVASYLELLSTRYLGKLDEKAHRWIGYSVDAANRMKQLINDLLDYSRVATKAKPFAPTDCNRVLDAALANLHQSITESDATITRGPLPTVQADSSQITQLFQNLIGNAIKYRGERTPAIHMEASRHSEHWEFSVRDNGIGIDPQFHDRIFVIFQRLHTRSEYPGTGIGLALCQKIVERHGGRIWVESQAGSGTTFRFTVPDHDG